MRYLILALSIATLMIGWNSAKAADEEPPREAATAGEFKGKLVAIIGKVIEVRRVANGPVIFEIDGVPAKPQFRALVYPMAVPRFGADPENVYLGQVVIVKGVVDVRKDLAQTWINDPSRIRLATPEEQKQVEEAGGAIDPTASPVPAD